MERKQVLIERRDAVAKIIINRPEKRNSISIAAVRELIDAFEELRSDDSISVVLTTGAGDDAYCAGRDLTEFPTDFSKPESYDKRSEPRAYHLAEVIRNYPKVTIAVVNGYCLGGGITLVLPHDLAIASEEKAKFGLPEIMRGFLAYPILATMFKTYIPTKLGFEMILTGKNWDAKRAMEVGLINRVVPHAQLQEAAWEWGAEISRWDRITLAYCKMAVHAAMEAPSIPLAAEIVWLMQNEHNAVNPKSHEGMVNFLAKRGPKAF